MKKRRYKCRLDKALFVLYQVVNELDYFVLASPVSSHEETIARIEWLKGRVGESITAVTLNQEVRKSMINERPWP